MFKMIEGLPDNVLGIEASGKVTQEDYTKNLIPHADEMMKKHGKIGLLYIVGSEFNGFELAALWEDMAYGMKHWSDVSHIAMVTDEPWMKSVAAMFAPLFPGEMRHFPLAEREKAQIWIAAAVEAKHAA